MLCSDLTMQQSLALYEEVLKVNDPEAMRRLCREDLFFLLVVACKRVDMKREWIYARCREVEADPDGHLDLWSREHYKSSIITFGLSIQDILRDPETTICIMSHTRPIAKSFLTQIKREFEVNTFLQDLFSEILFSNPSKESPRWSLDDGIIVKRSSNPKESTIEAWGLVDGQPTSKHFRRLVYDDVVTRDSVTTPEMIKKVTESWELSLNLAGQECKKRYIGTRYHANDTYKAIIERGSAKPRVYPATDDGTMSGRPVLFTPEEFAEKLRGMGGYTASCQLLQNPLADNAMGFRSDWLNQYSQLVNYGGWNFYLLVDPASEKKKSNDYTVMAVIGLAQDQNYYLVDGIRDRMNLTERTNKLFDLVKKWHPINNGYEKYGLQSDIEHIKFVQELVGYRFRITELAGAMPKNDRIKRLVPLFEQNRFYIPVKLPFLSVDGKVHDFVQEFIKDEYESFPVGIHDDMLDCISRIVDPDLQAVFPKKVDPLQELVQKAWRPYDPLAANDQQSYNSLATV